MARLASAAASGDRPQALRELRDLLASHLENAPPAYVSGLSKQLSEVMRELDAIKPAEKLSTVDALEVQRAKRRAETPVRKRRPAKKHSG